MNGDVAQAIKDARALAVAGADPKKALALQEFVVLPEGFKLQPLGEIVEKYLAVPRRKKGVVECRDANSFIGYWGLFHSPESRIFADDSKASFEAILDYHAVGDGPAGWSDHTVRFALVKTPEWLTWSKSNGSKMDQVTFSVFVEDNAPDVFEPPAAAMLEVARDLEAKTDANFASSVRLDNGQQQLTYQETITGSVGKGKMQIPESFKIRIPLFVGMAPVEMTARLRFRIREGKLTFWYDLLRPHKAVQEAFQATLDMIQMACGIQVLLAEPAGTAR